MIFRFLVLALLMSPWFSNVAFAGAGEADISDVIEQYRTHSEKFGDIILKAAMGLLITLFIIEVKWSVAQRWANSDGRFDDVSPMGVVGPVLIKNIMRTGFLYWIINGDILELLVKGFSMLGEQSAGKIIAGPGDIFFIGVDIANGLTKGLSENFSNTASSSLLDGALAAMNSILPGLIVGMACFFIILAFMLIAAQYAVILIQLYFFLAIHPLLLSFGATRFGKDFSAKQFSAAIVIGIRLLAIYFVSAVAGGMGDSLQTSLTNLSLDNLAPLWSVVGVAGLLAFMSLKLPAMASDVVSGTASLSAGDGIGAATAMGGAAGAIGGATASAFMKSETEGYTPLKEATALPGGGTSGLAGASSSFGSPGSGFGLHDGGAQDLAPAFFSPSLAGSGSSMPVNTRDSETLQKPQDQAANTASGESRAEAIGNGGEAAKSKPDVTSNQGSSQSGVDVQALATGGLEANSLEGGSIGGASNSNRPDEPVQRLFDTETRSMTEAARDIAHEEQSGGGSAQIHLGDD